ncbi:MAG: DUF357 domain-containing protein [Candidatus Aenigmatarchaeota archaeon]
MIEKQLKEETERWLVKAKAKRKQIKLPDKSKEGMLKNIDAYISDTEHFMKKGDLIRAFEAIIWTWSWIEILEELKVIET